MSCTNQDFQFAEIRSQLVDRPNDPPADRRTKLKKRLI